MLAIQVPYNRRKIWKASQQLARPSAADRAYKNLLILHVYEVFEQCPIASTVYNVSNVLLSNLRQSIFLDPPLAAYHGLDSDARLFLSSCVQ